MSGRSTGDQLEAPQSASVAERIQSAMADVTPAERRVARALLAKYPTAGLEPTAVLAQRADTSAPTVVRFISRLGVGGYRDFQRLLREEVQERRASPITQAPRLDSSSRSSDLQEVSVEVFDGEITDTISALPLSELDKAIDLLSDKRCRITSIGGRFTRLLAEYLDLHLRVMRAHTHLHIPSPHDNGPLILDAGRKDVFVIFDVRRYQRDVVDLSHELHDRGSQVILVTDPWLSPAAAIADVVLPTRVQGPSPFDSLVPATAVVEVLVAGVHARLGREAATRIERTDALRGDINMS